MKKLSLLTGIALLFLLLTGCNNRGSVYECIDKDVIDTTTGSFCGVDDNNVTVFKGIRYADASQKNRWKRAAQVDDFTTAKLADEFGDICSQVKQGAYASPSMSEDCLNLNVWKPHDANATNLKKVMVYIHGGAYLRGSGSQPAYNGENLVNKNDVIVVTFNYRLGVLGFLSLPDRNATESGNFGLMDQQMAIKWVYENIEKFGGDKESITVFGNSAGSTSVGIHLSNGSEVTNYIKGGIMQSAYMGLPLKDKAFADTVGADTVSALMEKCDNNDSSCIYDLNASAIVDVKLDQATLTDYFIFHKLASVFPYHPYIDGIVIKEDLLKASIAKPLLIGNAKDESNFMVVPMMDAGLIPKTKLGYKLYLDTVFGIAWADKIVGNDLYKFNDANASDITHVENLFNDFAFVCASRYFVGFSSAQNYAINETHLYHNSYQSSFNYWGSDADVNMSKSCEAPAVCHQAEIPYVFDNYYDNNANAVIPTDAQRQFSQKIMALWGDFANNSTFGNFSLYDPSSGKDNAVELNNTSPNVFEINNFYEADHNCTLWNEFYDAH